MVETATLSDAEALARTLADALDPTLPETIACPPLELLVALHRLVLQHYLLDIPRAGRLAAISRRVAERFPNDAMVQAQAHWTQGSAILYVPDYERSLRHYDQALAWYEHACAQYAPEPPPRDARVVQVVRVFCLSELGRYAEAQAADAAATAWLAEHPNPSVELTLLLNRSQLAGAMGDYPAMEAIATRTIALARKLGEPARRAQAWINRGYAQTLLGAFKQAEGALRRGVAIARRINEPVTLARAQWNQARLWRCQGRLYEALMLLRQAQSGLAQATGEAATVALEEAAIYQQLRQFPDALGAAGFAAAEFARRAMPSYSTIAYIEAARVAARHQRGLTARDLLGQAAAQAAHAGSALTEARVALAEAELAAVVLPGETAAALARRRKAARSRARKALRQLQGSGMLPEAARCELALAALAAALGEDAAARTGFLALVEHSDTAVRLEAQAGLAGLLPAAEAAPYLEQAADLVTEQRRTLPMEELQARYSSETSRHHLRLAACKLELGEPERAFEILCAAKAGPLLDLRAAGGVVDEAALGDARSAKEDLARWRQQALVHRRAAALAAERGQTEAVAHHTARAGDAESRADAAARAVVAAARTLGDRAGYAAVPGFVAVQAALPPGGALLEYAQLGDNIAACLLTHDAPPRWRTLGPLRAVAPLLDRWVLAYHRQRATAAPVDLDAALAPLRAMLLDPWAGELAHHHQLLIAPTGILYSLPWAALAATPALAHLTLTVTPSGAMWAAPTPSPNSSPGPPVALGYAGEGARRLGAVSPELELIARLMPETQVINPAGTTQLRTLSPAPRLLHIAAHGITNPAAPLFSTIELADGPLLLFEAYRLDLRGTDLVVLSACETGVRPDYGEMALALVGAFLCAGARAVVATLWQVDDSAAAALMERFYAALAAGATPATALRDAQAVISARYPLDWPAFQLWAGGRG